MLRAGALLGGLGAAGALVGCGDDGSSAGGSTTTAAGGGATTGALIASFPQSTPYIAAGSPARLPYLIADREGVPLRSIDGPVRFTVSRDGTPVGEPVEVTPRSDGVPRAYLPLAFTFAEPGIYDVSAEYGGSTLEGSVQVVDRSKITTPMVGDRLPAVASPTTANAMGVDPLCSRDPVCPYHSVSLDAAVASGRPTILVVSTPAFCQTAVCGPLLDHVMEAVGEPGGINVIHSEVYANPTAVDDLAKATVAPVPKAFDMAFEPALFVADASGVVVSRGDIIVDRGELAEMLAPIR